MNVAIVGGGVGGLSAAYDLALAGAEVTLFEASDSLGGLAGGFKIPRWDWSVEKYYHHWFASDRYILGLIDELGWSRRLMFPRPITAVYHQGDFYALDSPLSVLRFPGLPPLNRLWMGMVIAYLKYIARWKPLESVTADSWLRRWMGDTSYERLWKPLLFSKFGDHYAEVNMAWMWARFKARTPRLGTFEGGFQAFIDAFADRVRKEGVEIRMRAPVQHIAADPQGGISLTLENGSIGVDQCLVTSSPAVMAKLAPNLSTGTTSPRRPGFLFFPSWNTRISYHRLSSAGTTSFTVGITWPRTMNTSLCVKRSCWTDSCRHCRVSIPNSNRNGFEIPGCFARAMRSPFPS
jgi:protoporphyrinogen oxidase